MGALSFCFLLARVLQIAQQLPVVRFSLPLSLPIVESSSSHLARRHLQLGAAGAALLAVGELGLGLGLDLRRGLGLGVAALSLLGDLLMIDARRQRPPFGVGRRFLA